MANYILTHTGAQVDEAVSLALAGVQDGSITAAKIQDGSITAAKLNSSVFATSSDVIDGTSSTTLITPAALSESGIISSGAVNVIRNPKFTVNQRVVSGTVTLTAGSYGHDGWKAGSSGCTYTFATSQGRTTLTISAGSLVQTIDGADLFAGTNSYTLSWGGTCQGKIGSGSYAASGVTGSATGGTNIDIEFGTGTLYNPQFEIGTVASSFSCLDDVAELTRCRQYLPAVTNLPLSGTGFRVLGFGYVNSSNSFTLVAPIGTGIKGRPTGIISSGTFTVSASGAGSSATSPTYGTTMSPTVGTVTFSISGLTLGNAGILMADSGSTLSQILFTGLEP